MSVDTPMFRQYFELKEGLDDALLFFRMGDFYELFFDDARVAAEVLELTLTSRNKDADEPVPMAGVPHHAARGYIARLVEAGHKVAIADQVEDPKLARGLVRREIVRVVSPGVALDPDDLQPREPCWILGLAQAEGRFGLALLDVSVGELRVAELDDRRLLLDELGRVEAREAVVAESLLKDPDIAERLAGLPVKARPDLLMDPVAARRALCQRLEAPDLGAWGCEAMAPALAAAEGLLSYAAGNLRRDMPQLSGLRVFQVSGSMVLDAATRRNLELFKPLMGSGRRGSLLHLLDRCATAMGGRLLREWLSYPLLDLAELHRRLDAVEVLTQDNPRRRHLREGLRGVADLERLAQKLAQQTAGPRDLARLATSLDALPAVVEQVRGEAALQAWVPEDLCGDVAARVQATLVDEPPVHVAEGGLIRPGVSTELDELASLSHDGRAHILAMEAREREATGIASLKIRYNKVFGYYIELSRANLHKTPDHYLRKQTLSNAERFITPELKEFEERVLGADERRRALEAQLFAELRAELVPAVPRVMALARCVAVLDVFLAFADLAVDGRYVRPELHDGRELDIVEGRHPVVERQELGERFVPNDLRLSPEGRLVLILTGPNMSGKSTIMRQTALIVLMAQIGCFVPASAARVGLADRIFTRVGASDDLASGRSTFMVEMAETAHILHNATARSLIILDEIGRGTSTFDGLAIAWAVAEALHDRVRARTLFATHYHELVELARDRPNVANASVAVSEWGERIIFLRRLKEGGASRSYGIQCARLAGLPGPVIDRARGLLQELERHAARHPSPQLSLFGGPPPAPEPPAAAPDPLREALEQVDPDSLSPKGALELVYRLRSLLDASP